jgi:hypothetical protein
MLASRRNFQTNMKFIFYFVALWIREARPLILSPVKNVYDCRIRLHHARQGCKPQFHFDADQREAKKKTMLSMHMGHSHSHDHHHRNEDSLKFTGSATNKDLRVWPRRRRLFALVLFCAVAILGPPFARSQKFENRDVAAFLVTATSLFLLEPLRAQVQYFLLRIRRLGDGISRHSGPISAKYIFKNENAADRVTLLG